MFITSSEETQVKLSKTEKLFQISARIFQESKNIRPIQGKTIRDTLWVDVNPVTEVLTELSEVELADVIREYSPTKVNSHDYPEITESLRSIWRQSGQDLKRDTVAPTRFKSEPGLCWTRLDFDLETGVTLESIPRFKDLLSRCYVGREQLVQWIGSLFVSDSLRSQYIHMYGGGNDGKSSLVKTLASVLTERSYIGTTVKILNSNEGGVDFEGKRLIAFNDQSDSRFTASDKFKNLTGEGTIATRKMWVGPVTIPVIGKIIITSNKRLTIKNEESNSRRLLQVEISKPLRNYDSWEHELFQEASGIVSYCYEQFQAYVVSKKGNTFIEPDAKGFKNIIDNSEEIIQSTLDGILTFEPKSFTKACDLLNALRDLGIKSRLEQRNFLDVVEDQSGFKSARVTLKDGSRAYVYQGVRLKNHITQEQVEMLKEETAKSREGKPKGRFDTQELYPTVTLTENDIVA